MPATGETPDSDDSGFDGSSVATGRAAPRSKPKPEPKGAKAGPPSMDEWQDFFGRIVLRTLTDAYMHVVLKDVELTDRERESLKLDRDELNEMAAPFSSLANKSKVMRRHGRQIIAATDSYEAVICMVMWGRRVNRIAKRHAKAAGPPPPVVTTEGILIHDEPNTEAASEGLTTEPVVSQAPNVYIRNPGGG